MIPEKRVKKALLNVEIRQTVQDLTQINAAIVHLLSGGKYNYDVAKSDKEQYKDSSEEILLNLENQRHDKEFRLRILSEELNGLINDE